MRELMPSMMPKLEASRRESSRSLVEGPSHTGAQDDDIVLLCNLLHGVGITDESVDGRVEKRGRIRSLSAGGSSQAEAQAEEEEGKYEGRQ
jgi:hypothetical protein